MKERTVVVVAETIVTSNMYTHIYMYYSITDRLRNTLGKEEQLALLVTQCNFQGQNMHKRPHNFIYCNLW